MNGTTATTIRTSVASAVAARALATADSNGLAVLDSGVQADAHARAISRVHPLKTVRVWRGDAARAQALVRDSARSSTLR